MIFVNLMTLVYAGDIWEYEENFETVLVMRSDLSDEDTWAIYDIFSAMVNTYVLLAYAPTLIINAVIICKEALSDQFTFGYEPGDLLDFGLIWEFIVFSLELFGVPNDEEYYTNYFREFSREYL